MSDVGNIVKGGNEDVYIADGSTFEGKLGTKGVVKISGGFAGEIGCGTLIVTKSGKVDGIINTTNAYIAGVVNKEVTVSGELCIDATGVINGEVKYGMLAIEKGGQLNGSVSANQKQNTSVSQDTSVSIAEPTAASTDQSEKEENNTLPTLKYGNA